MAAQGNQPVSAANLAAALGVSASGSIGSQPISVDNLKAALGTRKSVDLYTGEPATTVTLNDDPAGYGALLIVYDLTHASDTYGQRVAYVTLEGIGGTRVVSVYVDQTSNSGTHYLYPTLDGRQLSGKNAVNDQMEISHVIGIK